MAGPGTVIIRGRAHIIEDHAAIVREALADHLKIETGGLASILISTGT
jgi:hypothetical protein